MRGGDIYAINHPSRLDTRCAVCHLQISAAKAGVAGTSCVQRRMEYDAPARDVNFGLEVSFAKLHFENFGACAHLCSSGSVPGAG